MTANLQVLNHDTFGNIRWLLIDDVPYFVGKDVCLVLAYKNPRDILKKHVDDEDKIGGYQIDTPSGKQGVTVINESGLYSLILSSKLPTAKKFKRWVTNEVLPSIRKTGSYSLDKDVKAYIEARSNGKIMRRTLTDTIKLFIEYARAQGCTKDDGYFYGVISILSHRAVGLPDRGGRPYATPEQLSALGALEGITLKKVLINGMAEGLHWTQIEARVRQQIDIFIAAVSPKPLLTSNNVAVSKAGE